MLLTQLSMGTGHEKKIYSFVITTLVLGIFLFQISDSITQNIGDISFASCDNLPSLYYIAFIVHFVRSLPFLPKKEKFALISSLWHWSCCERVRRQTIEHIVAATKHALYLCALFCAHDTLNLDIRTGCPAQPSPHWSAIYCG